MMSLLRRLMFNKVSRMAMVTFLWNRRYEVKRWGASLWNELTSSGKVDPARLKTLASVLLNVTRDPKLANAPELRAVRLVGDKVELDMDPGWVYANRLVGNLAAVKGVNGVEVRNAATVAA